MKKLMAFCFATLFAILAVLSCINYSYDGLERIEKDKQSITIKKPIDATNEQFLNKIDEALAAIGSDIMYRYVDVTGKKASYSYYKTSNSSAFISLGEQYANLPLGYSECLSTTAPEGFSAYKLKVSSALQDISFYNWKRAFVYDLSSCTYYIAKSNSSEAARAIADLGYDVTVNGEAFITGKSSVVLFTFVPICMTIMSMAFYVLTNGKKNVLRKMEGYKSSDILLDELRSNSKMLLLIFFAIELFSACFAMFAFSESVLRYIIFSLRYTLIGIFAIAAGCAVVLAFVAAQSGSEHIKGKAPKNSMYYLTMLGKLVFIIFIAFCLTIAIRNVRIAHNTYKTSKFAAEKINGYVTIPVFENNASSQGLNENYLAFYKATVDEYSGVLVNSSNYEFDLITGKTLQELYGQEEIVVNKNYLLFNPIYDPAGKAIMLDDSDKSVINVLIPGSKSDRMVKYLNFVKNAYSKEAKFIEYDGVNTKAYSYNADTGAGSYGRLDQPVIIVVETEDLDGIFVLSYCSKGEYFIKPHTNDPYSELLPLLKECGIDSVMPQTPYILSNFDSAINQQLHMLQLYGTQTLILSIGLACLIMFSAKLYCENYRDRIACCLIEGHSFLRCIRQHVIVILCSYLVSFIIASLVGGMTKVSMNYNIIAVAFGIEAVSALIACMKHTKSNLAEIMKGAE